jgi:hypothetical protein
MRMFFQSWRAAGAASAGAQSSQACSQRQVLRRAPAIIAEVRAFLVRNIDVFAPRDCVTSGNGRKRLPPASGRSG